MFTEDEVIAEAIKQYGKTVCVDQIQYAMTQKNLQDAVNVILDDSRYWDGDF